MRGTIHRLNIQEFPWTDTWASIHWIDDLWQEEDAIDILGGQKGRELSIPPGLKLPASYVGDKNIRTGWKWCEILTGPNVGDHMWIASMWFVGQAPAVLAAKKCTCPVGLLMTNGCKCGGI